MLLKETLGEKTCALRRYTLGKLEGCENLEIEILGKTQR